MLEAHETLLRCGGMLRVLGWCWGTEEGEVGEPRQNRRSPKNQWLNLWGNTVSGPPNSTTPVAGSASSQPQFLRFWNSPLSVYKTAQFRYNSASHA
jgi:hypothetical protein